MDSYIDQTETLAYGEFTIQQIPALVRDLDKSFVKSIDHVTSLLEGATSVMRETLGKAGELSVTTYSAAAQSDDPLTTARSALKRAVKYAESRPEGEAIASRLLGGETLTTVLRRRPAKFAEALVHAKEVIVREAAALPEHKAWVAELTDAKTAVDDLNTSVRKSRSDRRAMTPAVQAARADWLRVYGAVKLQVECVLRLHGKESLMSEVFDDLAEMHRAPGVSDTPAPGSPPANSPATTLKA